MGENVPKLRQKYQKTAKNCHEIHQNFTPQGHPKYIMHKNCKFCNENRPSGNPVFGIFLTKKLTNLTYFTPVVIGRCKFYLRTRRFERWRGCRSELLSKVV
jgi:hypothetical protein